jgi:ABC-type uncharacterized transport system auxiliary subunit
MNRRWAAAVSLASLLAVPACSSILVKSTPPPVYYRLDHEPRAVKCPVSAPGTLRIWPFSASAPFDEAGMVVVEGRREVRFSGVHYWVAPPGTMLAQSLIRDFDAGSLFPQAVGAEGPAEAPFELTGRVFDFSWDRSGTTARARLHVEVSLVDDRGRGSRVVFHREYEMESEPTTADDAATFADAMSALVERMSTRLREDLCTEALPALRDRGGAAPS